MIIKLNDTTACRALFFILAFYIGLWTLRIPTIKDQLETSYIGIGYIFTTFALGSILIMVFSNQIIKKFSSNSVIMYCGIVQALLWIFAPLIYKIEFFLIYSFIFGVCYGLFEVAINLQASNIESREKKSMMSSFHAFFSLGLLSGSFFTSLILEINISFLLNIIIYIVILLPLHILFSRYLTSDNKSNEKGKGTIFFYWPALIVILVIVTLSDSITEGGIDAWAALYMRDSIKLEGFKLGIATICFNFSMLAGRLFADKIRDKLGVHKFLISLLTTSLIGISIILSFNNIISSIIGFSVVGLGVSGIIPLAYSLAGKIKGIDSAVGISIISISAYGVFMVAPAFMGYIAKYFGINFVFAPMLFFFCLSLVIVLINKKKFIL